MSFIPRALLAATAAGALLLTGCSNPLSADQAAEQNLDGRGPITFAMGKNDADVLIAAIERWNDANPDEQVSFAELPGEADEQRNALVQSLQAQDGQYDVMALDVVWTAEFAANGWLQPLEDELALDTSGLLEATVDSATYRGTLYAGPQNTNGAMLFYRTDLVENAPTTWSELIESCPAAFDEGINCYVGQFSNYEGLTVNVSEAVNAFGGAIVGEDGQTPTVDTPEVREALQTLVDAFADGVIPMAATGFTEEETNLSFVGGEALYARNWPYMYNNADADDSAVKDNFGIAPLPGKDAVGASTLGGYNNAISVFSENKATAREFIEFIQSPEIQRSFMEIASFPPVLASVYDDDTLEAEFPYLPVLKEALENAQPRPVTPFYEAISKAIRDNAYAAIRGDKSVDDAIADMQAAIDAAGR
ncbi:ABC transporter substrate-binding protein [Hoyosella rhizosphaerae]|uniref:ABC transporter substrate-binding protein n=1 Tax=Hoyosella rhizosphaerae TaxID=1755582 RepID=A0A916XDJ0_9ACTN|nr:ABC transporter substrate-binding protein [Hoyosella rhizosphaerae]MBN4927512.1 ABC transporter substrate-binding protein [Hoyosella rhizosphaerae]GGC63906.1 ABC transporter substrate-binding protein [Hoyosella rhizosphaerae]